MSLPDIALHSSHNVLCALKEKEIVIRYSDGSLLGLLRDGKFIEHDNDVDFDVLHSESAVYEIKNLAIRSKWKKVREVVYHNKVQQLTYIDGSNVIYDFIFWIGNNDVLFNFSEKGYIRLMQSHFLISLVEKNISGLQIDVPVLAIEWLESRYGKAWNIPQCSKGDWKEDCTDLYVAWWYK